MMLSNVKRTYLLATFTVEKRPRGWFYRRSYSDDEWQGPYSSESSVCPMVARQLKRELLKRDSVHNLP